MMNSTKLVRLALPAAVVGVGVAAAVMLGSSGEKKTATIPSGTLLLAFRFTELEVDGNTYLISTEPFHVKGKSDATESALEIGGGAIVGGVLKGAKGAIVGAAIGTGVAVATED